MAYSLISAGTSASITRSTSSRVDLGKVQHWASVTGQQIPDDRVFVCFAGIGLTVRLPDGTEVVQDQIDHVAGTPRGDR
jgi:hypothetical protein